MHCSSFKEREDQDSWKRLGSHPLTGERSSWGWMGSPGRKEKADLGKRPEDLADPCEEPRPKKWAGGREEQKAIRGAGRQSQRADSWKPGQGKAGFQRGNVVVARARRDQPAEVPGPGQARLRPLQQVMGVMGAEARSLWLQKVETMHTTRSIEI